MCRVGYVFNQEEIIGGGEISFIDLADVIREFGVEPVAFVPGPGEVRKKLSEKGIAVVETAWSPIRLSTIIGVRRRQVQLAHRFKDLNLDLVHVNGARSMLYAGPAARQAGIPCVWHVRVLERDKILDRIRARYATKIVANSCAVASSLRALGIGKDRLEVIYNGLRIDAFQTAQPLNLYKTLKVRLRPVILCVGRFTHWKGFEDVIWACNRLHEKRVPFSLIFVGAALPEESAYERRLRRLVVRLGLQNVYFAGWRNDIGSFMKSADVLVVPSHGEPFGRVIVEAWGSGLPVIATNAGGPAEIIRHEETGVLYEPGNINALTAALVAVLGNKSLAKRLAENGERRARNFSLEKHAEQVAVLYRQVMA